MLALVGSEAPSALQWDRWRASLGQEPLAARLRAVYLDRPAEVVGSYVGGGSSLAVFAGEGPVHSTRRPSIEFTAPRGLFGDGLAQARRAHLRALVGLEPESRPPIVGAHAPKGDEIGACRKAVRLLVEAFVLHDEGRRAEAREQAMRAAAVAPDYDVPSTFAAALADAPD